MRNPTVQEIAKILAEIGPSGEKREEKIAAIQALNLSNPQEHKLHDHLDMYEEF